MTRLELMRKHRTDKAEHRFDIPYSYLLDDHRHDVTRVLETSVKRGASLRVWEDYFPKATIFGIDINPKYAKSASHRSRVFVGSQADPELLQQVSKAADFVFDLIVDDGSHLPDDQVASLKYLWPFLKPPHGIYALEDLHAHVRFPDHYSNAECEYPPMSDMLVQHMERRLAADSCASGSPGISAYGAIAFLMKGEEGPAPDFDQFLKRATTTTSGFS
jgi:hypothetical protein